MTLGLAIVGYGKMGRLIEPLGPEYGFDVRAKFNSRNNLHGPGLTPATLNGVDVEVEFSTPDAAAENIRQLASAGVNVAGGTTGWAGHLPVARQAVTQNGSGLVWAPNFRKAAGIRRVGLGNPSWREKRCAIRDAAEMG
jgi:4-hydroxy-tetrahydrodipicolinate reductase